MADTVVKLDWTGEGLAFRGGAEGSPAIVYDSDGELGPSPMQTLAGSIAACMGIDVVMILEKSRVPVTSLSVTVEGDRSAEPPRRFTGLRIVYHVAGPTADDEAKLQRAVDLSRDKYCSVLHSMRSDLDLEIRIERD